MRVSDPLLYKTVVNNLQQNLEKALNLQEIASSGKRILNPSDDPIGIMKVMDYDTAISKAEQYQRNIDNGVAYLSSTESAISTVQNILVRAKELSITALNGTISDAERRNISEEVDQLRQQVIQVANTRVNGRYIFAGFNTGTLPYDSNGNYTGTLYPDGDIEVEIDTGSRVAINVTGDRIFGTSTSGLIVTLESLKSALQNNDTAGINDSMGKLDSIMDQVGDVRAEIGARMNRLESAKGYLNKLRDDLIEYKSKTGEADITNIIAELAMQQNALEMSRAAASRVFQQSLLDFLK